MTLERSYARALFDLATEDSSRGSQYLQGLKDALKRRGHEKLLPKIFSEYQSLALKEERSKIHGTITEEQERTRVLLELYRKLIQTNN